MVYRKLGSTGLAIGEISLGGGAFEYHERTTDTQTAVDAIRFAVENGVNFVDLPLLRFREAAGLALQGIRRKVLVSGHLGCCSQNGTYSVTRSVEVCEGSFHDLLSRLRTDYVDILMLHCADQEEDYAKTFDEDGFLGLALRFKREGKARTLAISTHVTSIAMKAITSGTMRLLDAAERARGRVVMAEYRAQSKNASDCTRCGECVDRCPFGVPVLDRMERTIEVLGVG